MTKKNGDHVSFFGHGFFVFFNKKNHDQKKRGDNGKACEAPMCPL